MDNATTPAIVAAGLETRRLSRTVLDQTLVSDISVAVRPGEILAVVGPSGAGKSSFLRLLNRLDKPTSGTVRLNGEDYREMQAQDLRRRVGMVMQRAYLFPGTVAMNVGFGPQQRGEKLSIEQIAALLERVGLPGYQARDVSNLSAVRRNGSRSREPWQMLRWRFCWTSRHRRSMRLPLALSRNSCSVSWVSGR
jgi:putative ABC transport system ATP-binding protein